MAAKFEKHYRELELLASAKPKLRKAILENCETSLIKCLCECCHNILKGYFQLPPNQLKTLRRHSKNIRLLASKKGKNLGEKREILVQKGGLLPALIGPVLAVAASLIPEIVRGLK